MPGPCRGTRYRLPADAYVFSRSPDGSAPLLPDSVTQRYERMARKLKIKTTLHKLRHYSATELIAAGVDVRTVAGRLGHSGEAQPTLRVYPAWTLPHGGMSVSSRIVAGAQFGVGEELQQLADRSLS
jgi:integrase